MRRHTVNNTIPIRPGERYRSALRRWNKDHPSRAIDTWTGAVESDLRFSDGKTLRQVVEDTFEAAAERYDRHMKEQGE
jgi:hypothetical protein